MRRAERPSRAPRSTPLWKIPTQVHRSALKIRVMPPAAKEGTFSASSDRCVFFPLAASVPDSGVYPKTRVWGTKPENVHCSRATSPLRIELRWGCEEYSGKTAVGSGVSFKYDPFGRRIYKSSTSGTSVYAYDGDNLAEEANASGGVVARYSQGLNIDEPLAMLRSATTSYYEADGLGSLTSLSDNSGSLAATYTYDSFGNLLASSGSIVNNFRYTGREFDPETSLYYYRTRYYDPGTGRFVNEDPLSLSTGLNFYRYVDNNPPLFNDPFGLWKNTGKPADPYKNTIVCDGKGSIRVQLNKLLPSVPEVQRCLGPCLRQHEQQHKRDALQQNPMVCQGSKNGIQVGFSNNKEQASSEIAAYNLETKCLENQKKQAKCDTCNPLIDKQLRGIREDELPKWNQQLSPSVPKLDY